MRTFLYFWTIFLINADELIYIYIDEDVFGLFRDCLYVNLFCGQGAGN